MNKTVIKVSTSQKLFRELEKLEGKGGWIYRGQRDPTWNLKTSIDRMFEDMGNRSQASEIALVKRFQREAHHYNIFNNDFLNIPEWLSIMQHYGAPTRLLDWTHSPWVGLFFAIIDSNKDKNKRKDGCALWAINWNAIDKNTNQTVKDIFKRDYNVINISDFNEVTSLNRGVIKLNSFRQNQRQIIQQGTFLFPLNINYSFEENLKKSIKKTELIKIHIPSSIRSEIIQKLYRMNISFTTLYPGIEGFGRSLNYLHHINGIMNLEENVNNYHGYMEKFKK